MRWLEPSPKRLRAARLASGGSRECEISNTQEYEMLVPTARPVRKTGDDFYTTPLGAATRNAIRIRVRVDSGNDAPVKTSHGRTAWALDQLIRAGGEGCTPIDHPGPRWSDYTFKLRKAGISVETITEPHGGSYSGHHAPYVLRSPVTVLEIERTEG
jgi:Winged helix domain